MVHYYNVTKIYGARFISILEFLQNNVYCNRIPQSILADLQQRLEV